MRLKIVAIVLVAGLAGLAVILYLKPRSHPPVEKVPEIVTSTPAVVPATSKAAPSISPAPAAADNGHAPAPLKPAPGTLVSLAPAVMVDDPVVQAKIDRLEELQANYDAESLREILSALTDTNPVIRHVAIEATTQFRDRAAIPTLENLAASTTDPAEKQELLDAAEFLKLPTYTEVMQAKQAAKAQNNGNH